MVCIRLHGMGEANNSIDFKRLKFRIGYSLLQMYTVELWCRFPLETNIFIDREAGEIIRLVASIHPSVCPSTFSRLNRLTYDLDFWHEGRP